MPYISEEGKLTLRDIKRTYNLSNYAIAAIAYVEPKLVNMMEQRGALTKREVEKILGRLALVTGQDYSMETVGGYWVKEEEE